MKLTERQIQTVRLLLDERITNLLKMRRVEEALDTWEVYMKFDGYYSFENFQSFVKV